MHGLATLVFACLAAAAVGDRPLPKPIFYLPMDGTTDAVICGGTGEAFQDEIILAAAHQGGKRPPAGQVGQCYDADQAALLYGAAKNFSSTEGTCAFWVQPQFRGDDKQLYCAFFGVGHWGMLYKYENATTLSLVTVRPGEKHIYHHCGNLIDWRPGQWHHVVLTWSRRAAAYRAYIDGKLTGQGPLEAIRDVGRGSLAVGGSSEPFSGKVAHARMDEFALWDRPLEEKAVTWLYQHGLANKPLWNVVPATPSERSADLLRMPRPEATPDAHRDLLPVPITATRVQLDLSGSWPFLPSGRRLRELPQTGWAAAAVPGYWAGEAAQGNNAKDQATRRRLAECAVGYYRTSFLAAAQWKNRAVLLHLDGVDGWAELYLNGQRLGELLAWENEDYELSPYLEYGRENTLIIALHARGENRVAGIYGKVSLEVAPRSMIRDVVVRPSVEHGSIAFSCDLRHEGQPAAARLDFEVSEAATPQRVVKRFSYDVHLPTSNCGRAAVSTQTVRVECAFPWSDARLWTYDDPLLYQVRTRLRVGGSASDDAPPTSFGFREFTVKGGDFYLNGKPTHLRGHQLDLAWHDQMPRLEELKTVGMNCFQLSGPIAASWYTGQPYRIELFEKMLDYADYHGLIALPGLPDAMVIRDAIFDPDVARLYRQRLEKHIRRWGNHPSICLWFMHFNLANYLWYVAPSKMAGYKPNDPAFLAKERFALEAQRIAQSLDPRPIYHHACGNFGDIFSTNCYLGPNIPLQEREEWPSRWAEKRPFPLVLCETCLMVICNWYRPREMPLEQVYAGEPLFDEIAAQYLGRRAYRLLSPQLFDRYDLSKQSWGERLHGVIQHHAGYQEVKARVARDSLRSWRTFGVSGIGFNAENWDYRDTATGRPLPVMKAVARYFADTDLYFGGPGHDWPSKDHAFFGGEKVHKQAILLNDLTRDLPVELRWQLTDRAGKQRASGQIAATARAGVPTMCPIEFTAPEVSERSEFQLRMWPRDSQSPFLPEVFDLQVFPRAAAAASTSKVLVFDPVGETTKLLAQAGVAAEPLREHSDLRRAALVVVGKKSYGPAFRRLAVKLRLIHAVEEGLNLLVFEQVTPDVFGLKLTERSLRDVFIAEPGHPLLAGLRPADLVNLRGQSDLVEAYPEVTPGTEKVWPARGYKWGNRGITTTFVYRKPHYAPLRPILECGFDLVDSPLLEGHCGSGRILLCQVDVTSRYGADPVSTRLVDQSLVWLGHRGAASGLRCACVGESAKQFVRQFGVIAGALDGKPDQIIVVGKESVPPETAAAIEAAVRGGATALLLPESPLDARFGLKSAPERLFIGRLGNDPLLAGLNEGDLYLKAWTELPGVLEQGGWQVLAKPGIVARKVLGQGQVIACQIDPEKLGPTRGRIKTLRFWNVLLANLGLPRAPFTEALEPRQAFYEDNPWEEIPRFRSW
jgi:beta-galactosidase